MRFKWEECHCHLCQRWVPPNDLADPGSCHPCWCEPCHFLVRLEIQARVNIRPGCQYLTPWTVVPAHERHPGRGRAHLVAYNETLELYIAPNPEREEI